MSSRVTSRATLQKSATSAPGGPARWATTNGTGARSGAGTADPEALRPVGASISNGAFLSGLR